MGYVYVNLSREKIHNNFVVIDSALALVCLRFNVMLPTEEARVKWKIRIISNAHLTRDKNSQIIPNFQWKKHANILYGTNFIHLHRRSHYTLFAFYCLELISLSLVSECKLLEAMAMSWRWVCFVFFYSNFGMKRYKFAKNWLIS